MPAEPTPFPLQPQIPAALLGEISAATQALIDLNLALLNHAGGDPDLEDDDTVEANGDELDASWTEGGNDLRKGWSPSEDAEEDNEDQDGFENEPMFHRGDCARLSALHGDGAGCSVSGDVEPNGDEGDYSDADCGHVGRHGIDQSRPISPDNPEAA